MVLLRAWVTTFLHLFFISVFSFHKFLVHWNGFSCLSHDQCSNNSWTYKYMPLPKFFKFSVMISSSELFTLNSCSFRADHRMEISLQCFLYLLSHVGFTVSSALGSFLICKASASPSPVIYLLFCSSVYLYFGFPIQEKPCYAWACVSYLFH